MKKQIENPYRLNLKFYIGLLTISIFLMAIGFYMNNSIISEIVKNLGYGCMASTIVALIIEIGNIDEKNRKFKEHYEAAYAELQFAILKYLDLWAEFCHIASGTDVYKDKMKKWKEWYELSKKIYMSANQKRKAHLDKFLIETLLTCSLDDINRSLQSVISQKYLLEVNELYNSDMEHIINDFNFEFKCARHEIGSVKTMDNLWHTFDALNADLTNYINKWVDISYYNELEIGPYYKFGCKEYIKAIMAVNYKKKKQ